MNEQHGATNFKLPCDQWTCSFSSVFSSSLSSISSNLPVPIVMSSSVQTCDKTHQFQNAPQKANRTSQYKTYVSEHNLHTSNSNIYKTISLQIYAFLHTNLLQLVVYVATRNNYSFKDAKCSLCLNTSLSCVHP